MIWQRDVLQKKFWQRGLVGSCAGRMGKGVVFTSTLLCPWIRLFTIIISAWWFQTSSKLNRQEVKEIHKNFESLETPKQLRIPPTTKKSLK